jgi:hypothetical protein
METGSLAGEQTYSAWLVSKLIINKVLTQGAPTPATKCS